MERLFIASVLALGIVGCGLVTVTVEQKSIMDKGNGTEDSYSAAHSTSEENAVKVHTPISR